MFSAIPIPSHWKAAQRKDIERELCGLVTNRATLLDHLKLDRDYELIWAFDHPDQFFDHFRVFVLEVRSHCYHAPSRPGWYPITRSRVIRGCRSGILEVKWATVRRKATPVAHDPGYGRRSKRYYRW